jgi:AcrR family transcriptional regulator
MRRRDIIRTAAQIFGSKGYHATSMQDIADAVRLQKASLYHHITSKQEILVSILDQALDLLIEDMQSVLEQQLTPTERIRRGMQSYLDRLTQDADLAAVLLLEHRNLDHELRSAHVHKRDVFEKLWRQIIQEGIDAGEFREVDVRVTTYALLGVLNWTITWFSSEGRLTARDLSKQFSEVFLEGLMAYRSSA